MGQSRRHQLDVPDPRGVAIVVSRATDDREGVRVGGDTVDVDRDRPGRSWCARADLGQRDDVPVFAAPESARVRIWVLGVVLAAPPTRAVLPLIKST